MRATFREGPAKVTGTGVTSSLDCFTGDDPFAICYSKEEVRLDVYVKSETKGEMECRRN